MIGLAIQNIKRGAALWAIAGLLLSAPASAAIYTIDLDHEIILTLNSDTGTASFTAGSGESPFRADLEIGQADNNFGDMLTDYDGLKEGKERYKFHVINFINFSGVFYRGDRQYRNGTGATLFINGDTGKKYYNNIDNMQAYQQESYRPNTVIISTNFTNINDNSDRFTNLVLPFKLQTQPPTTSVPEPGALGLMGLGLFTLALSRRRRRKPVFAAA